MTPTHPTERIQLLDTLRGFALFGVLLVNVRMLGMTTPDASTFYSQALAEGKFYALFSMLFGYGLVLFIDRAEARGTAALPLITRRLLILACIGAGHVLLGWWGDILIMYAVVGSVAVWFRHSPPRILFSVALTALIAPVAYQLFAVYLVYTTQGAAGLAASVSGGIAPSDVYTGGTFAAVTAQRVGDYVAGQRITVAVAVFGYMLAGMGAERAGLLSRPPVFWSRVILWTLPVGIVAGLFYAVNVEAIGLGLWQFVVVSVVAHAISAVFLAAAYVGMVYHAPQWVGYLLAPVGRLALTNYLTQTAVMTFVFYGYGLGLYGSLSSVAGVGLALVVFGLQIPFSHWWLAYYDYGPAEGVWRRLTYWQPVRVRRVTEA